MNLSSWLLLYSYKLSGISMVANLISFLEFSGLSFVVNRQEDLEVVE